MSDLISRQVAIDAISSMFAPTPVQKDMVEDCLEIIESLSSVKLKTGKWIDCEDDYYYLANCSNCGFQMDVHENHGYFNFCPNCGAEMELE